jgi:hypothetical protein
MVFSEVKLLSHASLLITVGEKKILTDPWFFGTAFNDGWELFPKPNLEQIESELADVDVVWISHEHPDHLHFPTLKWLMEIFKKEVKIYFQENNNSKVFEAIGRLGYKNFVPMPHMRKIAIAPDLEMACYAHRHLDSAMAIFVNNKFWLLNINDVELNKSDASIILGRFGAPAVLYNQFSVAGFNGIKNSLATDAVNVLEKMVAHHKLLNAGLTVPFASYVRFARMDNIFINDYSNTVFEVKEVFSRNDLNVCVQAVGGGGLRWLKPDAAPVNSHEINAEGEEFYLKHASPETDVHDYPVIPEAVVAGVIESRLREWYRVTNPFIWKLLNLGEISFEVVDWGGQVFKCDFGGRKFFKAPAVVEADIRIASQPLFQSFKLPFGIQTLGVSGRYVFSEKFNDVPGNWKKIRILSSLYNAGIYLSLFSFFSPGTLKWIWSRRSGLMSQVVQQVRRFKNFA